MNSYMYIKIETQKSNIVKITRFSQLSIAICNRATFIHLRSIGRSLENQNIIVREAEIIFE